MMEKKENPRFDEAKQVLGKLDPYVGIVLEEISGQYKTIVEQHNFLEHKIDRVDANLKEFRTEANEKFDMIFECQKNLLDDNQEFFTELRTVKSDATNLERRVTQLENV